MLEVHVKCRSHYNAVMEPINAMTFESRLKLIIQVTITIIIKQIPRQVVRQVARYAVK